MLFRVIFTLKVLSTNASNVSNILTEVHKANYLPKIYYKNLLLSSQNDRLVNFFFLGISTHSSLCWNLDAGCSSIIPTNKKFTTQF